MTEPSRFRVTGHYAGAVSRAAATALDVAIVLGLFAVALIGLDLLGRVVVGRTIRGDLSGVWSIIALVVWAFLYMFISLAIAGRTPGKSIVGLRVVAADGSALSVQRAFWRTLTFPLSGLVFGLGYLFILVQRERRALHDLIAGTAVVYDWNDRVAELPAPLSAFLARRAGAEYGYGPGSSGKVQR